MRRGDGTSRGGLDLSLDLVVGRDGESSTVLVPDVDGPEGDVEEAWDTDEERDTGVELVGDGALHRWEDGSTGDTHDDHGGSTTGVSTETSGGEDEDDGVHDRLEEHDGDGAVDTS